MRFGMSHKIGVYAVVTIKEWADVSASVIPSESRVKYAVS